MELIVEKLIPLVTGCTKIKIWDAGCASGEEPFTLAIILSEQMNPYAFRNVKILASDIDNSNNFKRIIEEGIYPYEKLKRIPKRIFKKYFILYKENQNPNRRQYQLKRKILSRVKFLKDDLLNYEQPDSEFRLILCKNVLFHQTYQQRIKIINMFYASLADKGILAMEHTQKLPQENKKQFKKIYSNAQIFQKEKQ